MHMSSEWVSKERGEAAEGKIDKKKRLIEPFI